MTYTTIWQHLSKQESVINFKDLRYWTHEQCLAGRTALQFLSWIPVGQLPNPDTQLLGKSVAWYPAVGLLLGLILGLASVVVTTLFNDWISAALILALWVWLTGALHLDGLADSADAWLGGLGSKARTLTLMKDPTSGPIAIATLILLLFLKLTCLHALLQAEYNWVILWSLIFARCNAVLLLIHTPYVREKGLGANLSEVLSKKACYVVISFFGFISLLTLGVTSVFSICVSVIALLSLRHLMLRRLEGCTGDTLGALIELSETLILLSLVACLVSL